MNIDWVRQALPGRRIDYHETLDSTMLAAARLASEGCRAGTAVVAGRQTAGQGRHGHSWYSPPGAGLYVSIVLRPQVPFDWLPVLTLATGLAAVEAIARSTNLRCDLRWPNDLMLDAKKVGGILLQLQERGVIAGIGINVSQDAFPAELAAEATSLLLAAGREPSREDLLIRVLQTTDAFTRMLEEAGRQAILDLFTRTSSYAQGKDVTVQQGDDVIHGVTAGLDESGFLKVRRAGGDEITVLAGGVRAARA